MGVRCILLAIPLYNEFQQLGAVVGGCSSGAAKKCVMQHATIVAAAISFH